MAPKNKPLYRRILLIVTLIFLPLFGLLVFLMPSPVEATAYYPTGDVVKIFPPESVLRDAFESDDFAYVFDEQQNITLTQSLILNDLCQGSCTLPVGTLINSHFIHADSVNEGSVTWYAGSVSFDTEVLGIIKTTSSLDSTDERFGVEETTYAGNETDRGLENGQDTVTLSSDRRTITISFGTLDKQDQIRVITQGGPSLPDPMIWNTDPDCPFCTANQAIAAAGGPINTRNGNLSYSATDLTIPVLGQALTLRRSYASQAIDTYTTTLGYGWSHHFDMRLRFSYPGIENAIALQSPGGNLLPFYVITSTPEITTYLPYPGVTASLEQITTTYVVTAFNQMTYVFNPQGQLIR